VKVLTFCAYYTPEIAASMYITTNLFEDWAAHGIDIEVYVPTPTRGVDAAVIEKYKRIKKEVSCDGHLIVHRFSMMQEGKGMAGRALRYLLLNLKFLWYGLRTKADILFIDSTPPTQGPLAALLKKCKSIPMVYNLQDVFPDSLVNTGICSEKSILFKLGCWMEKITYRNSDAIIAISEDFRKNLVAKGVPQDRITVVYNWVDENAVLPVGREKNVLFDRYGLDRSKFCISYCGNIGFTQNMELLIRVAKSLELDDRIRFVLIGDGAYTPELERLIKERNIGNVILLPFQPYGDISHVFSLGDCGLIISKAGVGSNSVPSKTWSYMSAECPIIASFDRDSELQKMIRKADCGIGVDADDEATLTSTILAAADGAIKDKGKNGRAYVIRHLTREAGTRQYASMLRRQIQMYNYHENRRNSRNSIE
jgi:glycosyltransferase involved in cell wall biosynthesis